MSRHAHNEAAGIQAGHVLTVCQHAVGPGMCQTWQTGSCGAGGASEFRAVTANGCRMLPSLAPSHPVLLQGGSGNGGMSNTTLTRADALRSYAASDWPIRASQQGPDPVYLPVHHRPQEKREKRGKREETGGNGGKRGQTGENG